MAGLLADRIVLLGEKYVANPRTNWGLYQAGYSVTGQNNICIGYQAGQTSQGSNAIAIGSQAGRTAQGNAAVALGNQSGNSTQGQYAVAIGFTSGQTKHTIKINGSNIPVISTGMDKVTPFMVGNRYVPKAKEDGTVIKVDN